MTSCTCFEVATAEPALLVPLVSSSLLCVPWHSCAISSCTTYPNCHVCVFNTWLLDFFTCVTVQMAAREKVRAAVEEALGFDLGLLVEFTGLITWRPGAHIAFHHDANRLVGAPVSRA